MLFNAVTIYVINYRNYRACTLREKSMVNLCMHISTMKYIRSHINDSCHLRVHTETQRQAQPSPLAQTSPDVLNEIGNFGSEQYLTVRSGLAVGRSDASERHRVKGFPNQTNKKSSGLPRHDHQRRRWTRVQYRAFTIATHRIEEQCDAKGHAYGRSHDDHELPSISELHQQFNSPEDAATGIDRSRSIMLGSCLHSSACTG